MVEGPSRWDEARCGPLTLGAIHALHRPDSRFRLGHHRYPAGAAFGGAARGGRLYVIAGECAMRIGDRTWVLSAGDIASLPEGAYRYRSLGTAPVEVVWVWELPPEFRGGGDD